MPRKLRERICYRQAVSVKQTSRKSKTVDVDIQIGSLADVAAPFPNVGFAPESGHR